MSEPKQTESSADQLNDDERDNIGPREDTRAPNITGIRLEVHIIDDTNPHHVNGPENPGTANNGFTLQYSRSSFFDVSNPRRLGWMNAIQARDTAPADVYTM